MSPAWKNDSFDADHEPPAGWRLVNGAPASALVGHTAIESPFLSIATDGALTPALSSKCGEVNAPSSPCRVIASTLLLLCSQAITASPLALIAPASWP